NPNKCINTFNTNTNTSSNSNPTPNKCINTFNTNTRSNPTPNPNKCINNTNPYTNPTSNPNKCINTSTLIITTPEKLEILTRNKNIFYNLLLIDEIHIISSKRGVYLESIISRLIYNGISRIVGVSATVSNWKDFCNFLRVEKKDCYVYDERYRPIKIGYEFVETKGVNNSIDDYRGVRDKDSNIKGVGDKSSNIKGVSDKSSNIKGVSGKSSNIKGVSDSIDDYKGVNTSTNKQQGVNNIPYKQHPFNTNNTLLNNILIEITLKHINCNSILIFTHSRKDTYDTALYIINNKILNNILNKEDRSKTVNRALLMFNVEEEVSNYKGLNNSTSNYKGLNNSIGNYHPINNTINYHPLNHSTNSNISHLSINCIIPLLYIGIGIHHGGLQSNVRNLIEYLFKKGVISILVSTSTLAWGVNLPAWCVIIKGCLYKNSKELSDVEVMQMFGRCGRTGYDKSDSNNNYSNDISSKTNNNKNEPNPRLTLNKCINSNTANNNTLSNPNPSLTPNKCINSNTASNNTLSNPNPSLTLNKCINSNTASNNTLSNPNPTLTLNGCINSNTANNNTINTSTTNNIPTAILISNTNIYKYISLITNTLPLISYLNTYFIDFFNSLIFTGVNTYNQLLLHLKNTFYYFTTYKKGVNYNSIVEEGVRILIELKYVKQCYNYKGEDIERVGGVNNSIDYYKGVNNKDSNYKGVNNLSNKQQGVNKKDSNYKGVNNLSNKQHPFNTGTNIQHPFNNSTTHHPFNNSTTHHPLNNNTINNTVLFPLDKCVLSCKYFISVNDFNILYNNLEIGVLEENIVIYILSRLSLFNEEDSLDDNSYSSNNRVTTNNSNNSYISNPINYPSINTSINTSVNNTLSDNPINTSNNTSSNNNSISNTYPSNNNYPINNSISNTYPINNPLSDNTYPININTLNNLRDTLYGLSYISKSIKNNLIRILRCCLDICITKHIFSIFKIIIRFIRCIEYNSLYGKSILRSINNSNNRYNGDNISRDRDSNRDRDNIRDRDSNTRDSNSRDRDSRDRDSNSRGNLYSNNLYGNLYGNNYNSVTLAIERLEKLCIPFSVLKEFTLKDLKSVLPVGYKEIYSLISKVPCFKGIVRRGERGRDHDYKDYKNYNNDYKDNMDSKDYNSHILTNNSNDILTSNDYSVYRVCVTLYYRKDEGVFESRNTENVHLCVTDGLDVCMLGYKYLRLVEGDNWCEVCVLNVKCSVLRFVVLCDRFNIEEEICDLEVL
ncbi:hypothetical protein CWI37_1164p0010, partial [Hamiltosporidium tvaerminnensis]